MRSPEHVQVFTLNGTPLFFAQRDGPWYPTLRLLHKYPDMMVKLRADVGAIKFVLSGANIMAPGLTSPGATMHEEVISRHCLHILLCSVPSLSLPDICLVGKESWPLEDSTSFAVSADGRQTSKMFSLVLNSD